MPAQVLISFMTGAPRATIAWVLVLMMAVGLTDGMGLLLLVPLLALLQEQQHASHAVTAVVDKLFSGLGIPLSLSSVLGLFLLLIGLRSLIQYQRQRLGYELQFAIVDDLRTRCFRALLHAQWPWLTGSRQNDHASLLLNDINRVGAGIQFGLSLAAGLTTMGAYLFTAIVLSWKMSAIASLCAVIVFYLLAGHRRRAFNLGGDLSEANKQMQQTVSESLGGLKMTKILGNETRQLASFQKIIAQLRTKQKQFQRGANLSMALYQVGTALLLVGFLFLGLAVLRMQLAELLVLVLIFARLIPQFSFMHQQLHHLLHTLPACKQTQQLLRRALDAAEPDMPYKAAFPPGGDIILRHAAVHYPNRQPPALVDVSVCIPANTTTVIMGASGSGKSTLADVLMGLQPLNHGRMQVGDAVIEGQSRIAWRQHVAYVPQDVFLFNETIRHNLLWANPDCAEKDLRYALLAAAADFVFDLPDQLDTVVGDAGNRLSGGERQRIALARALLRKPQLLILDEATSALDDENQHRVYRAITKMHGKMTVIIVGHQFTAMGYADHVMIMDRGSIHTAENTLAKVEEA